MKIPMRIVSLLLLVIVACNTSKTAMTNALNGKWELTSISGITNFKTLYNDKKPMINFDLTQATVSGNSGCNSFSGPIASEGNKISFKQPMVMTKMFCEGEGENKFFSALEQIDNYSIEDGQLLLKSGNKVVMQLERVYARIE